MATLGIVEFFIFLLHKYYTGLNIAGEKIFADVHFTLFYTALFNAVQSVILAFFVSRNSDRLWVRTEYQDLHHYVEIREEFERLDRELHWKEYEAESSAVRIDAKAAQEFEFNLAGIKRLGKTIYETFRHPILSRKHNTLLIQLRYHELKYHFIHTNGLPITLNVSDYLKRSELQVLTKLIHISAFAWLLLTGGATLVYFLMGITVFVTDGDQSAVGSALTTIYFVILQLFVVISLLLYHKMKWIFRHIMHMKLSSNGESMKFKTTTRRKVNKEIISQNDLFWGGSPKYITTCIQFMQFGYAVFLAILLVFWKDINVEGAPVEAYDFLLCAAVTYSCFVAIMAHVIPRFTLCSSMGQLVNHRRLQETLARHRLEDAQRKRQQEQEEEAIHESTGWEQNMNALLDDPLEFAMKGVEQLFGYINPPKQPSKKPYKLSASTIDAKSNLMWELTQLETKDLRNNLPIESQETLFDKEQKIIDRRNRRRSVSDGVATMRMLMSSSDLSAVTKSNVPRASDDSSIPDANVMLRKARRKGLLSRSASASASIEMMRDHNKYEQTSKEITEKKTAAAFVSRRNRRKTVSAQANISMMRNVTIEEEASTAGLEKVTSTASFPSKKSFSYPELHSIAEGEGLSNTTTKTNPPVKADCGKEMNAAPRPNDNSLGQSGVHVVFRLCPVDARAGDDKSTDGKGTIMTEKDDGDESDDEDIPDVDEAQRELAKAQPAPKPKVMDHVRSFFRHRQYKIISSIFGTLTCFFVVGMRLERMLIVTGLLIDSGDTWGFTLEVGYWVETSLLICFFLISSGILYLFRPGNILDGRDRVVFVTAALDVVLVSTCLILLMVAESVRCCSEPEVYNDDHARDLAGVDYSIEIVTACCPRWGTREHGGFGNIEPFTSLIALRIARFWVAKRIVMYLDTITGQHRTDMSNAGDNASESLQSRHLFDPLFDKKKHHDEHHKKLNFNNEKGTVVELWKVALELYPDIVEKHGEFSGELLQAMLGIEILKNVTPSAPAPAREILPDNHNEISIIPAETAQLTSSRETSFRHHLQNPNVAVSRKLISGQSQSIIGDRRYVGLTPEAQSIILSGKVGQSVRSKIVGTAQYSSRDDSFHEHGREQSSELVFPSQLNTTPEFEVITEEAVEDSEFLSQFVAPNSRLLRSMRRCDKKLLPLLNTWTTVDVVMTKHEIVYFDVADIDCIDSITYPDPSMKRIQNVRQALIATKGGQGLRLRDVAFGRRVVGRQELSLVESVYVTRVLPHEEIRPDECAIRSDALDDEFWKPRESSLSPARDVRHIRWATLKEDRIKIQTKHDTLYLRFYSDLDNMENNVDRVLNESETEGSIFKNNAYQWCQTIARLCGSEQLHQRMPHFGDDDFEELRDYLIIVDVDGLDVRKGRIFRRNHFRNSVTIDNYVAPHVPYGSDDGVVELPADMEKVAFRRASSFRTTLARVSGRDKLKLHRRSRSVNERDVDNPGEILSDEGEDE